MKNIWRLFCIIVIAIGIFLGGGIAGKLSVAPIIVPSKTDERIAECLRRKGAYVVNDDGFTSCHVHPGSDAFFTPEELVP